jgi:hypothetical protein
LLPNLGEGIHTDKRLRASRSIVIPLPYLKRSFKTLLLTGTIDLKRELISQQVRFEITELNSPTALHRFGAPFKSDFGEVSPLDSDLPILRYIFVHHVREFPFLDKAKEKEFWQEKLQVVSDILPQNGTSQWGTDLGFY